MLVQLLNDVVSGNEYNILHLKDLLQLLLLKAIGYHQNHYRSVLGSSWNHF
jgi:hypothetical protein